MFGETKQRSTRISVLLHVQPWLPLIGSDGWIRPVNVPRIIAHNERQKTVNFKHNSRLWESGIIVHIVCDQALKRLTNCFVGRKEAPFAFVLWIFLVWLVAVNWGNQWEFRTAHQSCCLWALLRQCTVSALQSSALILWTKKTRKIFALTG